MKVFELINMLSQCHPDAELESVDGGCLDEVCYHAGMKRVSLCNASEVLTTEALAPGWIYLTVQQPKEQKQ